MPAIDFFLWTISIVLWLVVIIPSVLFIGAALWIVVRDFIETPRKVDQPRPNPPNLHGARVVFLKPKGPAA